MSTKQMLRTHHHNTSNKIYLRGMTLIEVIICIFVIGIGIIAIARLMTHNIQTIARVHLQTTATTLAREGLEMVSNVRDTNTLLGYERNCAIHSTPQEIAAMETEQSLCKSFFWTGDNTQYRYTIDGGLQNDTYQIVMKKIGNIPDTRLYLTGINIHGVNISGYTHSTTNTKSPFTRYIEFTGLTSLATNGPIAPSDIHTVRSIVIYEQNNHTGQVILESFIANKE